MKNREVLSAPAEDARTEKGACCRWHGGGILRVKRHSFAGDEAVTCGGGGVEAVFYSSIQSMIMDTHDYEQLGDVFFFFFAYMGC